MIVDDLEKELFDKLKRTWGFHPWFIVRVNIAYILYIIETGQFSNTNKRPLQTLQISVKDFLRFLKIIFLLVFWPSKNLRAVLNKPIVLGYQKHAYTIDGRNINLYTDPFRKKLTELNVESLLFYMDSNEKGNVLSRSVYKYYKCQLFFQEVILKIKIRLSSYHKRQFHSLMANEQAITSWLSVRGYDNAAEISAIITNTVLRNEVAYRAFDRLCKKLKPKYIWAYCFYDNDTSAFSRAAKQNKIDFIDYQHSQQSDSHFAYGPWPHIEDAHDFFPSTFWVWRRSDHERIMRNFTGVTYRPRVMSGGNIWISDVKSKVMKAQSDKSVLICLQGTWLPDFILRVIESSEEFLWYIRLHPRYSVDKPQLVDLATRFPHKVKYEHANNLALHELLAMVSVNVTAYSGSALEADAFGIKNIIFSEKGYQTYKNYIDEGVFEFVYDEDSFYRALLKDYTQNLTDPVITDQRIIVDNIKLLRLWE
jgi:hypothetical protein